MADDEINITLTEVQSQIKKIFIYGRATMSLSYFVKNEGESKHYHYTTVSQYCVHITKYCGILVL